MKLPGIAFRMYGRSSSYFFRSTAISSFCLASRVCRGLTKEIDEPIRFRRAFGAQATHFAILTEQLWQSLDERRSSVALALSSTSSIAGAIDVRLQTLGASKFQ
jgi:hypothetical protein